MKRMQLIAQSAVLVLVCLSAKSAEAQQFSSINVCLTELLKKYDKTVDFQEKVMGFVHTVKVQTPDNHGKISFEGKYFELNDRLGNGIDYTGVGYFRVTKISRQEFTNIPGSDEYSCELDPTAVPDLREPALRLQTADEQKKTILFVPGKYFGPR